jgi:hypothetical protein
MATAWCKKRRAAMAKVACELAEEAAGPPRAVPRFIKVDASRSWQRQLG